jgi:hypothetical protein
MCQPNPRDNDERIGTQEIEEVAGRSLDNLMGGWRLIGSLAR